MVLLTWERWQLLIIFMRWHGGFHDPMEKKPFLSVLVTFHMYLCLYVYIHNALACYLNLYPNYMTVINFITHLILLAYIVMGKMRIMTSTCYSYAIFIHFPPDFIFLIMPKSNYIMIF